MRVKSVRGVIFYIALGLFFMILLILLILSFIYPDFTTMKDVFKISFPIYTSIVISLISSTYRHFFRTPWLTLDLENSRHYLIDEFDLEENEQTSGVDMKLGERVRAKAKYIRINLLNNGKETAKNCRIKLHIYYTNSKLVREPSNLYPSGFHHFKKERKPPPFIDIAAGDSQIFDICSTTNINVQKNVIRVEDYFNYSRIEAKNNPLILDHIKEFYIKLFVYSDNSEAIEEQFKIFKDHTIDTGAWRRINIKKFEWEKQKAEIRTISRSPKINEDIKLNEKDETKSQKEEFQPNEYSQKAYSNNNKYDEYLNGDQSTGL